MKKIVILVLVIFMVGMVVQAQDKIHLRNGEVLDVKVLEQNEKVVRFKTSDKLLSPRRSMRLRNLSKIEYADGAVDLFYNANPRFYRKFGLSAGSQFSLQEEAVYFNLNADYFILPQLDVVLSIGSEVEGRGAIATLGANYHVNNNRTESPLTPYVGVHAGIDQGDFVFKLPIGVSFINRGGLYADASLSYLGAFNLERSSLMAEIKLGYRFEL